MDKKKIIWAILFLGIAALSVWTVIVQCGEFSLENFIECVYSSKKQWIVAAVLCMLGFIFFEGLAVLSIIRALGYKKNGTDGFVYASADIYFSAITPSATGGQPASAYFMMKDGIPGVIVTVSLLVNLVMYTAAILLVGLFSVIVRAKIFMHFHLPAQLFICVGYLVLITLGIVFIMLLKKEAILYGIVDKGLRFLHKIHLVRNLEKKQKKLEKTKADYKQCIQMIQGQRKMLFRALALNLLQRISQISVTVCVYLAMGGKRIHALDIWVTQCFSAIGSNSVPIPGSMGVADYLLLDGFKAMMSNGQAANMELLSRSLSFYTCILISGITVIVAYLFRYIKSRAKQKIQSQKPQDMQQ